MRTNKGLLNVLTVRSTLFSVLLLMLSCLAVCQTSTESTQDRFADLYSRSLKADSFDELIDSLDKYLMVDKSSVHMYLDKLLIHAKSSGNTDLQITAIGLKAQIDLFSGESLKSLPKFEQILQICLAEGDKRKIARAYANYGTGLSYSAHYTQALESYELALDYYQEINDLDELAFVYQNIGFLYMRSLDDQVEAKRYFEHALKVGGTSEAKDDFAVIYANLAIISLENKEFDLAKEYLEKARCGSNAKTERMIQAVISYVQGQIAFENRNIIEAKKLFNHALSVVGENYSPEYKGEIHTKLADVARFEGNFSQAVFNDSIGYASLKKLSLSKDQVVLVNRLAKDYGDIGNYERAFYYLSEARALEDSLEQLTDNLSVLSIAKFEAEEKIRSVAQLDDELNSLTLLNWFLIGVAALVILLLSLLLYRQVTLRKKSEEAFQESKTLFEDQRSMYVNQLSAKTEALKSYSEHLRKKNEELEKLHDLLLNDKSNRIEPVFDLTPEKLQCLRILTESDWDDFKWRFNQVYPEYLKSLGTDYPQLTVSDTRFFALLKLNLGQHQIADILGISKEGARKAGYRLRKKLLLDSDAQLIPFVKSYDASLSKSNPA